MEEYGLMEEYRLMEENGLRKENQSDDSTVVTPRLLDSSLLIVN